VVCAHAKAGIRIVKAGPPYVAAACPSGWWCPNLRT
jgi:hypothetical protein